MHMDIYLLTRFLVCHGNFVSTLEYAVFAFDSALKSRHEVGSSLIQVGLRGLLRKCFNCGVAQCNEVYNVHTSRIKFNSELYRSLLFVVMKNFLSLISRFLSLSLFICLLICLLFIYGSMPISVI